MAIDYEKLANRGMSADQLASVFLREYYNGGDISYPVNPFQMLTDLKIAFVLRPFNKYEGVYIPAEDEEDFPIIGINLKRPIVRQRFMAAHELCHHLKDVHRGFVCMSNAKSEIEKYAENFASELLMPTDELGRQVQKYAKNGYVDLDGVLRIADYFGVSFQSCLYKIAYRLHMIEGDTDAETLQKSAKKYKPAVKRKEQGKYDTVLYEQLFDAIGDNFKLKPTEYACQKFKTEYVFHDSRLEGVDIDPETAAAIVMDLRFHKQDSPYCREENQNIIEVAGLTFAYDYAFGEAGDEISIYDAKHLNERLFSAAPCPEYGGRYRETNTLVLGARFETIDYRKIPEEMYFLDKEIKDLMDKYEDMPLSEYVERVVQIHHKMTVIHAFRDGNGRTTRAFANMLLLKRDVSPVFFKDKEKDEYKEALKEADLSGQYDMLYERFFKSILSSFATLSDFRM